MTQALALDGGHSQTGVNVAHVAVKEGDRRKADAYGGKCDEGTPLVPEDVSQGKLYPFLS